MRFNFDLTDDEVRLVAGIVDRAAALQPDINRLRLTMDLTIYHNHAAKLDLEGLLHARYVDFVHDLNGLIHHLNRETGQLEDHFLPRYARRSQ